MHLLLMVWKNSKWFNTPPALAVLMCEICNDLIEQASGSAPVVAPPSKLD